MMRIDDIDRYEMRIETLRDVGISDSQYDRIVKYHLSYNARDLDELPTLTMGQADSLKINDDDIRVWLSRCGTESGEPYNDKISIEARINGIWHTVIEYCGDDER